ncbi:N4 rIIA-like protein [Roseovarius Plymouth podovirus 1]|uniref:N4 rIIA-like protein n=2 Tax=Roseovarius Plymouth podovirus 1 TaxID=926474 RepID=K4Q523_9CAUD|nr:RIIA lysis inhibitor [Roseovarius Plymouth podovirus 1]CBX87970.1 N4 rIIA-like protein [Roseovarius Plymouth podovirus 1]
MDTREFEQDHVLVGQKGEVGKATVTNDPILMSMLSTGLYANPLKSMVQEVTFNAWDAHRMGKCLDKPIDIYFNDTTGLIIRDYGPGIPPGKTFTDVYFTYGGSTKRDDDDATGGFGLGSKSPFAYTDTFNVTSHHDGAKYMYIMHRVHEENDGGPGHTPIIQGAPTPEKGLMVSVPFKNSRDKIRAYQYLKDILYMSGIKATIHFDGDDDDENIPPVELVTSASLKPTEFITDEDNCHGTLYAVYGGVSYEIPHRDEYASDYDFLRKIANQLGNIYVGFAPNTLTPLPTREGLNMSERSLESITSALETIQEHFMNLIIPATKTIMLETLKETKELGIQPHFVRRKWAGVGLDRNLSDMVDGQAPIDAAIERRSDSQNEASWNSIMRLAFKNTRMITTLMSRNKRDTLVSLVWAKVYPEFLHWRRSFGPVNKNAPEELLVATRDVHRQWGEDFMKLWNDLCDVSEQELEPRANRGHYNSKWEPLTNIRAAGGYNHITHSRKLNIIKRLDKENKLKVPTKPSLDTFWFKQNGGRFDGPMLQKTVVVAKTLTALNKTDFRMLIQDAMVPGHSREAFNSYHSLNWESWVGQGSTYPVAAFVIHKKKGQYDAAVEWLQDNGYNVIEADEPEERAKPAPKVQQDGATVVVEEKPKPKGYPKVAMHEYQTWASENEFVQKPSTYLYVTQTQIASYGDYPNKDLVRMIQGYAPNMVLVGNKRQATKLDKAGALSLWERLDKIVEDILADKERLKLMYFHHYLHNYSEFPDELLELPQMHKLMGVPYIRTKDTKKFFRDLKFIQFVGKNDRYRDGRDVPQDLRKKCQDALEAAKQEDSLVLARKMNKASRMFDKTAMGRILSDMKRGEKKVFIEKLARFLRTV